MTQPTNLILLTDSYKVTHWRQYPPGTECVYSYFESRGGRFPEVVFFGLQYILDHYLAGEKIDSASIEEAEELCAAHFGDATLFHRAGWERIRDVHGGRLPVSIRAVPEGTLVPNHNVLMTLENTDPECFWLTNYLESLLVQTWYASTVATQSRQARAIIERFLEETGDPGLAPQKLQDFGFRGVSSVESAAIGGVGHLVSFEGTDNLVACRLAREVYACDMAGSSIPASEHSTITAWGRSGEADAFRNMLEQFPSGVIACVSDSYDIYRACTELWGDALRDRVLARNGTLVVRPDSGDPPEVVSEVLRRLGDAFGSEQNAKGYRLLPPQVRVIQGDGVDLTVIEAVLERMQREGWSADNVAFGMGGALLQKLNRDTQRFAFKCSEAVVDRTSRPVHKDPVTDSGKRSRAGRLALCRDSDGRLYTAAAPDEGDQLEEVFRDGRVLRRQTLADIRKRARGAG
jgi:nicotinamide phosphoribosyltransferase